MKTRQEQIEWMLESICDWDLETLIDCVQWQCREDWNKLSDTEIKEQYDEWFDSELEKKECMASSMQPTHRKCTCSIDTLMTSGCKCNGR
jgi:hypothetical protein